MIHLFLNLLFTTENLHNEMVQYYKASTSVQLHLVEVNFVDQTNACTQK